LLKQAKQIFGPLPQVMLSEKNPITPEKVRLGKMLFYETRISVDGTVSCVRCHPIGLYAADGLKKSIGNNCKVNPRNAPPFLTQPGRFPPIGSETGLMWKTSKAIGDWSSFLWDAVE